MPDRQIMPMESRMLLVEREIDRLEKQVTQHAEIRQQVAVLRAEFKSFTENMHEDFAEIKNDVGSLRKTLIGASITVMIAAVGFALTSLAVFGAP